MIKYKIGPWPSTYKDLGKIEPKSLKSRFEGREVGASIYAIPPYTMEPPQIHLCAKRDGKPFEELITKFNRSFHVGVLNLRTKKPEIRVYEPGENIVVPEYVVHWLINPHKEQLEFTCEWAPHPWRGQEDEPEFEDLVSLWAFIEREEGLKQKVIEASSKEW